ncbi:hypothetical protein OIE66_01720 [Nonomuraea sp. NBC_01738]|uniref:arsenate reductase/protein-tyrosine-phosphatase family protein n=1 Tax=Nonomuraea sp. NBC_01738 TaxID=2976003 RepID=UPI002E12DC19|nr:hypothetical protein OIE66_01720 [Nonomuraea sp. NBC_01738]
MTLFVCTANICRSPIAERLALSVWGTGSPIAVISAGTHATAGRPMAAEAADALRELGGDPEGFVSRPLSVALIQAADLVLTSTTAHRRDVVTLLPRASARTFTIAEFGALAAAAPAREPVPKGDDDPVQLAHDLVAQVRGLRGLVRVSQVDVADPYGGPSRGYRAAARQIATGLAPLFSSVPPRRPRALDVP